MKNTSFIGLFLVFLTLGNIATNQSISQNVTKRKPQVKVKSTFKPKQELIAPKVIPVILPKVDSIDKAINNIETIQNSTSESLDAVSENSDAIYKKLKKIHEEKKREIKKELLEDKELAKEKEDSITLSKTPLPVIEEICRYENCIEMPAPRIKIPEKQTFLEKLFKWFPFNKKK